MGINTIVWFVVLVFLIVIEALTADIVTIWFIPPALVVLCLTFLPFEISVVLQIIVFLILSLVCLVLSKTVFKRFFKKKPIVPTNLDAVIGKNAVCVEKIDNVAETGAVKVLGKEWSARTNDGQTVDVGEIVEVLEISGVKLICKRI